MADLRNMWYLNNKDDFIAFKIQSKIHSYTVEGRLPGSAGFWRKKPVSQLEI